MIKLMKQKKAISPLVATVLLIAFAVALGAIVMNWGKGYIETQAQTTEIQGNIQVDCARFISLNLVKIAGENQLCYNSNHSGEEGNLNGSIEYIIKNDGTHDIPGFIIQLIGDTRKVHNLDLRDEKIAAGKALSSKGIKNQTKNIYNSTDIGNITQVTFKPYIEVPGQRDPAVCPRGDLTITNIDPCE